MLIMHAPPSPLSSVDALDKKLLLRLLKSPEKLSRNKNFQLFNDARTRRVRRIARHLQSIQDMIEGADVEALGVQRTPEQVILTFEDTTRNARRQARLSYDEWDVLIATLTPQGRAAVQIES